MEVIADVIEVNINYDQNSKIRATVKLLLDKPFAALELRLFEHHQKAGAVARFQSLVRKKAILPLEVKKYRDEIQYDLAFGQLPFLLDVKEFDNRVGEFDKATGEIKVADDIPFMSSQVNDKPPSNALLDKMRPSKVAV